MPPGTPYGSAAGRTAIEASGGSPTIPLLDSGSLRTAVAGSSRAGRVGQSQLQPRLGGGSLAPGKPFAGFSANISVIIVGAT